MLSWMAWTWPTALLFIGLFSAMALITVIEIRWPGLPSDTGSYALRPRSDRLFLSLLGAYIFCFGWEFWSYPLDPTRAGNRLGVFCFLKV